MISFGFSIGKLFDFLAAPEAPQGFLQDQGPVVVGSLLISLAVLFLIAALTEYHLILRRLAHERGRDFRISVAQVAATAMSLLGLIALSNLVWRF